MIRMNVNYISQVIYYFISYRTSHVRSALRFIGNLLLFADKKFAFNASSSVLRENENATDFSRAFAQKRVITQTVAHIVHYICVNYKNRLTDPR